MLMMLWELSDSTSDNGNTAEYNCNDKVYLMVAVPFGAPLTPTEI